MIIKQYEIDKIDLKKNSFFLLYGENQGLKNEIIENKFKKNYLKKTYIYEESEILNNKNNFFESITTQSFFESEKLIIINRASDKIANLIEEVIEKSIDDLILLLNANTLEKKSKLRSIFEKSKEMLTIPFYEDNSQTLSTLTNDFFRKKKIPISQQSMNVLVNRCRGDRQNLKNELEKIECFILNKKKIEIDELLKITNLADNYTVSELTDSCLAKNKRKTINILNENNYSLDDCIIIIRTLLIKSKRLLKLCKDYKDKKNISEVISNYKPPIFWKDKSVVEQQINSWTKIETEKLIFKINEIELLIKKNSNISVSILLDFLIDQASATNN
jgi:DNA polymerase III subunit delta